MADLIPDPLRAARLVLSLRRQGITDDGVLTALETVDRGAFVSENLKEIAAEDSALPIPCGQSIPRPVVTAKLLRALQIAPGKHARILLIGSGSGYTAALLSQICRHVYGVERYERLVEQSRERLKTLGVENVSIRHGNGLSGLAQHGPFDRILMMGAVKTIPAVLIEQLDKDGLLVTPIESSKGPQILRTVSKTRQVIDEPMPDRLALLSENSALTL
ncbi:MAG: protein-L-isoaspartate(D-aspartate) O-methyltransferase [Henriciella sp.]|nr:protein-L-isoaspartate(D-aspartate) O-methyltransferase [Hyphomonadaceae bacterium]